MGTIRTDMAVQYFGTTMTGDIDKVWGIDVNATLDGKLHKSAGYLQTCSGPLTLSNTVTFNGSLVVNNDASFGNASTVTFSNNVSFTNNFPLTPSSAPTSNYQVANKKYADDSRQKKWSIPVYTCIKTGDFAFFSVDEAIREISQTTSPKYAYWYVPTRINCTEIKLRWLLQGKLTVDTPGTIYLSGTLERGASNDSWSPLTSATGSHYVTSTTTTTETFGTLLLTTTSLISSRHVYRVKLKKWGSSGLSLATFYATVYTCKLTQ